MNIKDRLETIKEKVSSSKLAMELLLLFATFCWGMTYLWCDDISNVNMPISGYNSIRYAICVLMVLPFFARELKTVTGKIMLECSAMGLVYYGIAYLQIVAVKYTTPSCMAFLFAAYVVVVPFAARIFFKQKVRKKIYFSVGLCLVGIYLLNMTPGETIELNLGNGLSILGAFMLCFQILFLSHMVQHTSVGIANMVPWMVTCVIATVHALFTGGYDFDMVAFLGALKPILMMVIFGTVLSTLAQAYAQRFIEPSKAAIIYSFESVFACIMSITLGYEPLTKSIIFGGMILVLAIMNVEVDWTKKFLKKRV